MDSSTLRDYATVLAALTALLVFILNSVVMVRNRRISNLARFIETHDRLFSPDSYLTTNILPLERGELVRDSSDQAMEKIPSYAIGN